MSCSVCYKQATFWLFFLILTASINVIGQANNSIAGFVFGIDRQPLSNIPVELSNENYQLVSRVRTDGSGRYSFFRLTQGRYYIKVAASGTGYDEQTKDTEIVNINRRTSSGQSIAFGSDSVQLDFYLKPRRDSAAAIALTGVVFAQPVPKPAEKLYQSAVSDLNDQKIEKGISELKAAIEIFPDYYLALERLGIEFISQKNFAEALDVLKKAVSINPKGFQSVYSLGYAQHNLGQYSEAAETLSKAVELLPSSVNGWFILGLSQRQLKKYAEAETSLKKAEKLNPNLAEIHWNLALLYTNDLKKYTAAADELESFLKINPHFEEADKVRGLIKRLREKARA